MYALTMRYGADLMWNRLAMLAFAHVGVALPTLVLAAALSSMLHVAPRDRYAAHLVVVGIAVDLGFLYARGLDGVLDNPALWGRLAPSDLDALPSPASRWLARRP